MKRILFILLMFLLAFLVEGNYNYAQELPGKQTSGSAAIPATNTEKAPQAAINGHNTAENADKVNSSARATKKAAKAPESKTETTSTSQTKTEMINGEKVTTTVIKTVTTMTVREPIPEDPPESRSGEYSTANSQATEGHNDQVVIFKSERPDYDQVAEMVNNGMVVVIDEEEA